MGSNRPSITRVTDNGRDGETVTNGTRSRDSESDPRVGPRPKRSWGT